MANQLFGEEGIKNVSKWAVISLMLLSAFLLVRVIGDFKKLPNIGREIYPQSTINVSGSGEAYAIPDVASFNFSVVEVADTVKQAQEKADHKINKVLAEIRDSGVDDKDIKTTSYNVHPKYEWRQVACITYPCPSGKNVLLGYEVDQTISVKVRDTEKVGSLVTKVGTAEVSNVSGIQFMIDDKEQYVNEAREAAIKEAKEKAKKLAKQLGVKLGKIMYYNENGNNPGFHGEAFGSARDTIALSSAPAKAELPAGENKITSEVTITYEIK